MAITYPIQAVSRLTGLGIDTLRAWERRHGAINPGRNERGRVYHDADVQRLILLREAVRGGHAISKVAALSNHDLEQIKARSVNLRSVPSNSAKTHSSRAPLDLQVLHDAIQRFDCLEFDQELNRLAATLPARDLVHHVVVPLMNHVGDQWYRGDLGIAQEHMVSGALRNLLGSLIRLYARRQPTLLFATPKGERHEFGILCAAMLAAVGGLGVAFLGADLPSAEIVSAARNTRATTVVLGMKAAVSVRESLKELNRISEMLPSSVDLWVGGVHTAGVVQEIQSTRARYLKNFSMLEEQLNQMGACF